ncbi:MAG: hypothetical protein Q8T08_04100 [Ignavibacteria bacterium]|nr:hypothetical protein [Ignavibacteria bacterium]
MRSFIFILFLGLASAACTSNNKEVSSYIDSEIIDIWDNGQPMLIRLYAIVDGKKTVVKEVHYYASGSKKMEGPIVNDMREGKWTSWYEDGSIWSIGTFTEGLRSGKGIVYYPNGTVFMEGAYIEGKRSGNWIWNDTTGKSIPESEAVYPGSPL